MNTFSTIFSKILTLLPYLAAGVSVVHSDLGVKDKIDIANDALQVATAGAVAALPQGKDSELAGAIGSIASSTLSQLVTALHPSTTIPASTSTAS